MVNWCKIGVTAVTVVAWAVGALCADDQERRRHRANRHEHRQEQSENAVPAADDPTYREACGGCHFPLQPGLLPSRSWQRLMAESQDHFGQSLDLEARQLEALEAYLTTNGADKTRGELARDIIESVGESVPLRVTEVPKIRSEHRGLDQAVFERPSVGGRANCPACHHRAADGNYDDDDVTIPES